MSDRQNPALEGAWAYEHLHVDALFGQWTAPVLDAAGVAVGDRVLDVACGTGALARDALARVGPTGSITGLDVGADMLAVAEQLEPDVTWVEGEAGALPFADDDFDAVVSQFGLMFFPDRSAAIAQMLRCVRADGRVVVAVWDALERSAAYPIAVDLLERRAGSAAADALRAPFVLGDTRELGQIFAEGGAPSVSIDTVTGTACFPSVRSMVEADLRGWLPVMGVDLDEALIAEILDEADGVLSGFVVDGGRMEFDAPAHIVTVPA